MTGPAGPQFEVSVGVHYALAVLAETECFGLPGAVASKIAFQRRDQGHPLDDIILTGVSWEGATQTLEIQAKRSLSFTKSNTVFGDIVADMVAAQSIDPERRFAVAIERTSGAIENGVHEALELAKHVSDEGSFRTLLATPGRSNQAMRDFVTAFEHHLGKAGADPARLAFDLLRRFSVLRFDYARAGSIAEQADRWRAATLTKDRTDPYGELVSVLMRTDAIGGDLDRPRLVELLAERKVAIGPAPRLAAARAKVAELSRFALSDTDTTIAGAHMLRSAKRQALDVALANSQSGSGVLEITGTGGSGKSAFLKIAAAAQAEHAPTLVLAPDRVPSGGWSALQHQLGLDVSADRFLTDLASDGGAVIYIDGLDRFRSERERKTVSDLILTAARIPGLTLVFTARLGWRAAQPFSDEVMRALEACETLTIEGLDDDEAVALAHAVPALGAILAPNHPAKHLARNPFILKRFVVARSAPGALVSEAGFAVGWWQSGGHTSTDDKGEARARRRILLAVVRAQLDGASVVDLNPESADAGAVSSLIEDGVLTELATERVKFKHDLFSDWAIAAYLSEDPERLMSLAGSGPPAFWLERGVELAFRHLAEQDDNELWANAVKKLQTSEADERWTGLALLALVRSESAAKLFARHEAVLLADKGELAERLSRLVIGAHSIEVEVNVPSPDGNGTISTKSVAVPDPAFWMPLIIWSALRFGELPSKALRGAVDLMHNWIAYFAATELKLTPVLLDRFADLLVAHVEDRSLDYIPAGKPPPTIRYPAGRNTVDTARLTLAAFAEKNPSAAERYLNAIAASDRAVDEVAELLEYPFVLPKAAPAAFAAALIEATRQEYNERSGDDRMRRVGLGLSRLEHLFTLGKCGITPFSDLLNTDADQGLSLIRTLTKMTEATVETGGAFELELFGETRKIQPSNSYGWPRGHGPSQLVGKALAALEHWAHREIENGAGIESVAARIAGDGPISGALLLVITDLALCHGILGGSLLHDLLASPELLSVDFERHQYDYLETLRGGGLGRLRQGPASDRPIEQGLAARPSRHTGLHDVFIQVALRVPTDELTALKARLDAGVQRLGPWELPEVDWKEPAFMASYARRALDRENYREETQMVEDAPLQGWVYDWPEDQAEWMATNSAAAAVEHQAFNRSLAIRMTMDDETNDVSASVEDAEAVLAETESAEPSPEDALDHDPNDPWLSRLGAAAFLARQCSGEQLRAKAPKLRAIFDRALDPATRPRLNMRYDVMYDPAALGLVGLLHLFRPEETRPSDEELLNAILKNAPSAVAALHHYPRAAETLGLDRLKACIRTGLQACFIPRRAHFDETDGAFEQRDRTLKAKVKAHVEAELAWLADAGEEPGWVVPPPMRQRPEGRGIILPGGAAPPTPKQPQPEIPDYHFDYHTGDKWIGVLKQVGDPGALEALFLANRDWLVQANGGPDEDADAPDVENHWTAPLFECAARLASNWSETKQEEQIFALLDQFSSEVFFSVAAACLIESDIQHLKGGTTDTDHLAKLRARLWKSMKSRKQWERHKWSRNGRVEIHLNDLLSTLFMKQVRGFGDRVSYAREFSEAQLIAFSDTLTELAVDAGPCPTIATLYLDMMDLLPTQVSAAPLERVAAEWHAKAEDGFWSTARIGERVATIAKDCIHTKAQAETWCPIAVAISAAGVPAGETLLKRIQTLSKGS
ncbi:MAG: hypothetical protein CME95_15860 [Hyphomonadaceae bacterium]|nr:hypothetical protein [Hyphomonadaceae bacterium]